jgi:glycosyltransferase involved in cell wall biosynthesis
MKVALVVPGFSSHERDWCIPALLQYVRALAPRADAHIYTLRWPERRATYRVHGATVHALGGRAHLGPRAPAHWLRAIQAMAAEHRQAPFDVLHAFWADEPAWVATLAGGLLRRPVIVSLAGGELVGLRDIGYGLELLPGRRAMVRWVLARAAHVTAGSRYMLDMARSRMPPDRQARLSLAPLGVDERLFTSDAAQQPRDGRTLVCAAAFYPVKDHGLLLRVLSHLPGVRLLLAGAGPLQPKIMAVAQQPGLAGRVEFLGEVEHDRLPAVFGRAAVYVQASRHEAQGMAVLEAAACGLPAVGTPVGVLPEIGATAASELALAGCLDQLLSQPARRREAAEAARATIARSFQLDIVVRGFQRLYEAAGLT